MGVFPLGVIGPSTLGPGTRIMRRSAKVMYARRMATDSGLAM